MFRIEKTFVISSSHWLELDYESPCQRAHGHNWKIKVYCQCSGSELDRNGMVVDFSKIEAIVMDKLDHRTLNNEFSFNPTAENIAHWVCSKIERCYKVEVWETEDNKATYLSDDYRKE